ncbi:MAG: 2-hydroxyhepta-2,4-diene-1,7-dioate isomerase [Tistrella sp.]|jgi:2-keto-4-pentenoate hydratase/2-oxohepta-3-ene-1,7-dioic acid hydratase in catechol pathway|uniref:2-hydroxyhepta-2,4-diene-1,7-dioate isomerase n=1 Tax=Tistrella mobilis TaxID=171437 RepID=A0A3B9IDQ3_9PROT|nr:fumarylacetoacetate hydrolase family protein [Tistrella sp.]MAD37122.1 2-hydroxyhepta-2,4-diene-1,7-dioate isomerase [Tistrella sp.]MBA74577.1 2-hydroxyhepta-2,4-diene-1,7-dioate isomerase [Tistrella sp.]HAE45972.1 2-hydroxyhepta-2,4-diene-1,7-dioate isomerase [Tistrella mobilis]
MRLVRYGLPGQERPGLLGPDGGLRDLSGRIADLGPATLDLATLDRLKAIDPASLPAVDGPVRLGACIARPGKFVGIGLNYRDHAAEAGMALPTEPVIFHKATSCMAGPEDDLILPPDAARTDWEVELGVVIGRVLKRVSPEEALAGVAGYCTVNDISERSFQLDRGGQWTKGKSADGFGPVGPWLVTADEVPDPQALRLWLELNGERRQDGTTADQVFGVAEVLSYLSRFMTLEPGDLVTTGTPAGVGMGARPWRFLKPGDHMVLEVEGLGRQSTRVREG